MAINHRLAREAKAIAALAFRNGPIEEVHADSRITQDEMKVIMKAAVDRVYVLLLARDKSPTAYEAYMQAGDLFTSSWDDPDPKARL